MDWNLIWTNIVSTCTSIAFRLLLAVLVLVVGKYLIKLLIKIFPNGAKHDALDPTARTFIASFMKIALNCVLIVTIVAILGVPMASVITVFATAGAAIALAVQGSFSNMMGGIMLLIFRPISKGDAVKIDGETGVVNEVGIFYTELKTFDNLTVSIPNSKMTSSTIVNYSREENRRVDVSIDVAYGSDVEKVKEILRGVVEANEDIIDEPKTAIVFTAMKDSAIEFTIRAWAPTSCFGAVKTYLLEESLAAIEKAGIEVPFNQLDVTIKNK